VAVGMDTGYRIQDAGYKMQDAIRTFKTQCNCGKN